MTRRAVAGLAGALLAGSVSTPAGGLEPPSTARAAGLGVPIELLDDRANAFRFPQLAMEHTQSLSFHGAGGTGADGASLELPVGGQSVGYRARNPPREALLDGFSSPFYQVSWAHARGAGKIGAAFAWSTEGERVDSDRVYALSSGRLIERRMDEIQTANDREFTLGLTYGTHHRLDAAVTLRRRNVDYGWSIRTDPLGLTQYSRVESEMSLDTGFVPAVFLRAQPRPGVLVYGAYEEGTFDLDAQWRYIDIRRGVVVREEEEAFRNRYVGSAWTVGLRAGRTEAWRFHALFESRRDASRFNGRTDRWAYGRDDRSRAEAGISLERPGPAGITGRAGVRGTWLRTVERDGSRDFTEGSSERTRVTEGLEARLSWGAGRRFGPVQLDASLDSRLDVFDLIVLLDARVRL